MDRVGTVAVVKSEFWTSQVSRLTTTHIPEEMKASVKKQSI